MKTRSLKLIVAGVFLLFLCIAVGTVYATGPPPTVTFIYPSLGPLAGGTSVYISGSGFTGVTAVKFGGTNAQSFTFSDDNDMTAISPAGSGTVDITVTTSNGISATSSADQFTYIGPPTFTSIAPNQGPGGGYPTLTITGTNLGYPTVTFTNGAST